MIEENNRFLEAALRYNAAGFSVIPVRPRSKAPISEGWQKYSTTRSTKEEIEAWWKATPDANLGIALGPANGNDGRYLFVVDQDVLKDENKKPILNPDGTFKQVGDIRGCLPTLSQTTGSGGKQFFYWAPRGCVVGNSRPRPLIDVKGFGGQVLVPPSIHPNGHSYAWDLEELLPENIAEFPKDALDAFLGESEGTKLPISTVLAGLPVGKGLRHMGIAQVAGFFLRRATTQEEVELARLALYAWDRDMNKSPERWAERKEELDVSFDGILEKELKRRGKRGLSSVPEERPAFTPLSALLAEPEEETSWIVDGLLPFSGFSVVIAKPKVGKSTLIRQLAFSVARGEPFLGRKTTKGPVLYLSVDIEKRSEIKRHFNLLGATGEEALYMFSGRTPSDATQWLEENIREKKPVLVIIDTLFKFAQVSDVNDYAKVNAVLMPLLALARECSAHLLCLHHARKTGGEGSDISLGSTVIFGTVDTSIIIKKTQAAKRTIETEQRYGIDLEPTVLEFDAEARQTTLGGTKEESDVRVVRDAILKFLETSKESVDEPTIGDEVEGKTMHKRMALRDLVEKKEIFRRGGGRKGDPYLYSCFPVPDIGGEQEKQETKAPENTGSTSLFSRSEDSQARDVAGSSETGPQL